MYIYIYYVYRKIKNIFFPTNISMSLRILCNICGSNILQKDILTEIIKSKLNEIKV